MDIKPIPKSVQESDITPSAILDYTESQTFLRLDGTVDQPLVESLISAVTEKFEEYLSKKLISQVWSIYYDHFPHSYKPEMFWDGERDGAVSTLYNPINYLELPFGPCRSVSFVQVYDENDSTTAVNSTAYTTDLIGSAPVIRLKSGNVWPAVVLRPTNGVHVKATFGYGAKADIPKPILEAAKLTVAHLYEHRGDTEVGQAIPKTALMLISPFKKVRI